jgi:hypothetical protein
LVTLSSKEILPGFGISARTFTICAIALRLPFFS